MLELDQEKLYYQYVVLDKSIRECAEKFECGFETVRRYLVKYNIPKKKWGAPCGEKHGRWKGNFVGYKAIHQWVKRHKRESKYCENCQQNRKLELSNIDHIYRRDINDYQWLCRLCHERYHKKNNLICIHG